MFRRSTRILHWSFLWSKKRKTCHDWQFSLQREIKDKESTLFSDRLTFRNIVGADLRGMGWGGWTGWLANPFWRSKTNKQKIKIECECFSRNKGEFSGQVPDCNLYFVASLVFLVKQFYIRLQFSNCNILGTCPIDSATRRCQRTLSPLKKPEYAPCIIEVILRSSLLESREGINLIIIYYNYLLSDLLRERTKWIKFCAVIGEQDGAILPARVYPPCPARKISPKTT